MNTVLAHPGSGKCLLVMVTLLCLLVEFVKTPLIDAFKFSKSHLFIMVVAHKHTSERGGGKPATCHHNDPFRAGLRTPEALSQKNPFSPQLYSQGFVPMMGE